MNKEDKKIILEIEKLYQDFLNNYKKLNENLELTNIILIYNLYIKMLYRGYLSINKKFTYEDINNEKIPALGVYVNLGHGVCRHISMMLSDILNNLEIKAYQLYVCTYLSEIFEDNILKYLKNVARGKEIFDAYYSCNDEYFNTKELQSIKENMDIILIKTVRECSGIKYIDHVLTYAISNEKGFFLDPTNKDILKYSGRCLDSNYGYSFVISRCEKNVKYIGYRQLKKEANKGNLAIVQDNYKIEEEMADKLFRTNGDIFNKFYKNNSEIYREINNKLEQLKKVRKIIKR